MGLKDGRLVRRFSLGEFHGNWTMRLSSNRTGLARIGSRPRQKNLSKKIPSTSGGGRNVWTGLNREKNLRPLRREAAKRWGLPGAAGGILAHRQRPCLPRQLYENFSADS